MRPELIYLFIMMMLATAPSRVLPPFLLAGRKLPPLVSAVLGYMPFAVIGSITFPDCLFATGGFYSSAAGHDSGLHSGLVQRQRRRRHGGLHRLGLRYSPARI